MSAGDAALRHVNAIFEESDEDSTELRRRTTSAAARSNVIQELARRGREHPHDAFDAAKSLGSHCVNDKAVLETYGEESLKNLVARDASAKVDRLREKIHRQWSQVQQRCGRELRSMYLAKHLAVDQQLGRALQMFGAEQKVLKEDCQQRAALCALARDPRVDLDEKEVLGQVGELQHVLMRSEDILLLRSIVVEKQVVAKDVVVRGVPLHRGMPVGAALSLVTNLTIQEIPVRKMHVLCKNAVIQETFLSEGAELLRCEEILANSGAPRSFDVINGNVPQDAWLTACFRKWYDDASLHQANVDLKFEEMTQRVAEDRRMGVERLACKTSESLEQLRPKEISVLRNVEDVLKSRQETAEIVSDFRQEAQRVRRELAGIGATHESTVGELETLAQECDKLKRDAHTEMLQAKRQARDLFQQYLAAFEVFLSKCAMHHMMCCLHTRLESTFQELKGKRATVNRRVTEADVLCRNLAAACEGLEIRNRERGDKIVSELHEMTHKVVEARTANLFVARNLLERSVAERIEEAARRCGVLREAEAKIELERGGGNRARLLRKMQGDLNRLHHNEKMAQQKLSLALSLQERLAALSSESEIADPASTLRTALDEIFPPYPDASPPLDELVCVGRTVLAAHSSTNGSEVAERDTQTNVQKAVAEAFAQGYEAAVQERRQLLGVCDEAAGKRRKVGDGGE